MLSKVKCKGAASSTITRTSLSFLKLLLILTLLILLNERSRSPEFSTDPVRFLKDLSLEGLDSQVVAFV